MKVKVNGGIYACEIVGEGPPLMLLHGFTGRKETWRRIVDRLKNKFTCITVDLPGHGETLVQPFPTMKLLTDQLADLLDQLNFPWVHVLGYSMGGRIALAFTIAHPQKVQSCIIESAQPGLPSEIERIKRCQADELLAEKIENEGMDAFIDYWENIPLFASQKNLPEDIQREIRKERLTQRPEGLAGSLRYLGTGMQPSFWNQLKKIEQPVLLIVGALDEKFVTINQKMAERIQQGTLKIVPEVGHAVHIEDPRAFCQIILQNYEMFKGER